MYTMQTISKTLCATLLAGAALAGCGKSEPIAPKDAVKTDPDMSAQPAPTTSVPAAQTPEGGAAAEAEKNAKSTPETLAVPPAAPAK
jgi:predicted small lipoprotein YifL